MSKEAPTVAPHQWIRIGKSVDGYIFSVNTDGSLEVGYYQNRLKAIKETVVWRDGQWDFKYSGGIPLNSRTHQEGSKMGLEVCHAQKKTIYRRVQATRG